MTAGTPDVRHPSLMELAELDEGLLDEPRSATVDAHVTGCVECTRHRAELRAVGPALSAAPAPHLPAAVVARLDAVLAGEVERREHRQSLRVAAGNGSDDVSGHVGLDPAHPGPASATTGPGDRGRGCWSRRWPRRWRRPWSGFGAYVVSASAGLNEPPVVSAVSSQSLAVQAGALAQSQDLDPHRFSRAWQCARQATSGRIVALASSTLDGTPALLVYTRSGATTLVTVVTGCDTGRPSAGPSAPVPR